MNKFTVIGSIIILTLLVSGLYYVKKQWFDDGSVFTTTTISADNVSRVAAAGGDLRLYEFTPQTAKYMQCIFIAGENKGSTFCFRKEGYVATNKE